MTTDTKDLIARAANHLRQLAPHARTRDTAALLGETTTALERLTQPVGVGPVARVLGCINGHSLIDALLPADDCLYPAETVARLIAERGEALAACARLDQRLTDANHLRFREGLERDALQAQVRVWENSAPTDAYVSEFSSLQEQVKTLQRLVRNSAEFRLGVPEFEALADRWNTECDEMREDNKRLAAELATAREWNERYAIELRELREQKPVASLFRRQSNIIECFYRGSLCPIDGNNFHNDFVVALPLGRSVPLYANPVPAAQAECTHDCNQGRDCTCRKGGQ